MAKNKLSFWSVFILVVTIVTAVAFVVSVIGFATSFSQVVAAARTAAEAETTDKAAIELAVSIAVGMAISVFIASSVLEVFQIVGGFLFSLRGRWGTFCIIMSIISAVLNGWELINAITNKGAVSTIVIAAITMALSLLLVVACFKHREEIRA